MVAPNNLLVGTGRVLGEDEGGLKSQTLARLANIPVGNGNVLAGQQSLEQLILCSVEHAKMCHGVSSAS